MSARGRAVREAVRALTSLAGGDADSAEEQAAPPGHQPRCAGELRGVGGQGWSGQGDWKGYEVTNILKPVL